MALNASHSVGDGSHTTEHNNIATAVNLLTTGTGVPSYAGSRGNQFDTLLTAYNWKASNTRKMRASLGAVAAGTGYSHQIFVGASKMNGTTVGGNQFAWPRVAQKALQTWGYPIGGGASAIGLGLTLSDTRWASTGTPTNNGSYVQFTAAGTVTFTSTDAGQNVDIYYSNNSAAFTYQIDGGTATTITPTGTAAFVKTTITGLSNATHTVKLNWVSGTVYWVAVEVYANTSGTRFHNSGAQGYSATTWINAETYPSIGYYSSVLPAPSVVWIGFGANDANNGDSAATFRTSLTSVVNWYKGFSSVPDIVLCVDTESFSQTVADNMRTLLAPVVYDLADSFDCPLMDFGNLFGPWAASVTNGVMGADNIHESLAGQALQGRVAARLLDA